MKRIILSLLLIFAISFETSLAQSSSVSAKTESKSKTKAKKWDKFFGVEGGVGLFATNTGFFLSANTVFNNDYPLGLGYSVGILGGWQKYTFEKVGIRHTLGLSFSYVPNATSSRDRTLDEWCFLNCKNVKKINLSGTSGYHIVGYYALDGLFDFVKTDEKHRFGMSFGLGFDVGRTEGKPFDGGVLLFGSLRTGFYTRIGDNLFDVNLKLPIFGMAGGLLMFDTTLTLGYKHIF